MAYVGLDQGRKAKEAFLNAVKLLPRDGYGRIHAVAMLNLALTLEQLHPPSAELVAVFQSAKTMAKEMGYSDILETADAGIERLKSRLG
jgi:hypothetical protein